MTVRAPLQRPSPAAQAFPEASASEAAGRAEAAALESLEGLQQKVYRLRQFVGMLQKDMHAAAAAAGPKREMLRSKAQALSDKYSWGVLLGPQCAAPSASAPPHLRRGS